MSRLHVHLHVRDIAESVRFYNVLFGAEPAKQEFDYARWMLDNPRVNFAISLGGEAGLSHLGVQVEDDAALEEAAARARSAAGGVFEEKNANCCYAISDKAWVTDPQGIRWETFRTTGDLTVYGVGSEEMRAPASACCSRSAAVEREPVHAEARCGGRCR